MTQADKQYLLKNDVRNALISLAIGIIGVALSLVGRPEGILLAVLGFGTAALGSFAILFAEIVCLVIRRISDP